MRLHTVGREICLLAGALDDSESDVLALGDRVCGENASDRRGRAAACLEAAVSCLRDLLNASKNDELEQHLGRLGPYLNLLPELLLSRILEQTCDVASAVREA